MPPIKGRILCIEPVSDICALVNYMLHEQGYESDSVSTIAEAMEKAHSGDYCLFIVGDCCADGSCVGLIKGLREVASPIPIITFSSHVYERDRKEALEAGASSFLSKPEGIVELPQFISHLLSPASTSA